METNETVALHPEYAQNIVQERIELLMQTARTDALEEAALAVCWLCRDAPTHDNINPAEFLQVYNWRPQFVHFCISDNGEEMWTDCEANAIRALKEQD